MSNLRIIIFTIYFYVNFLISCILSTTSTPETVLNEIRAYRIRSEKELKLLTEISDLTFLLYFYKPNSEKSKKIGMHIKWVSERLSNLAGIALIDCNNFEPKNYALCKSNDYSKDSFPKVKLLIPPEKRFDRSGKKFETHTEFPWKENEMTEETIYDFIANNIPNKAVRLTKENYYTFLNSDLFNKVLLFTSKKEQSTVWRGLTNSFYDRILFGEVPKSHSYLVEKFNITKFPSLVIYKVNDRKRLIDEPEIIRYQGSIDKDRIAEWIEPHTLLEKRYMKQKRGISETTMLKEWAEVLQLRKVDKDDFENFLKKFEDKHILIYFNNKNSVKKNVKEMIVNSHPFFISAFFDCGKDKQFCREKFGVNVFPMLKCIPPSKEIDDRISNMQTFNISNSNEEPIESQILKIFPSGVANISNLEFPYKISEGKFEMKNIILHVYRDEENEHLLPLDLLSNHPALNKSYTFISLKNPPADTLKFHKIPHPSGIFFFNYHIESSDYQIIPMTRDSFYSSLLSLADNLVWMKNNLKSRPDFFSYNIKDVTSASEFKSNCLSHEFCAIAFFDANLDKVDDFTKSIRNLERISAKYKKKAKFIWVNATCHDYLLNDFGVDKSKLPALVFYYTKRASFSIFEGIWEDFALDSFVERCSQFRYDSKRLEQGRRIVFRDLICDIESDEDEKEEESFDVGKNIDNISKSDTVQKENTEMITENNSDKVKIDL